MPPRSKGRTGRPWRRAAEQLRARREPCWLCHLPIDYNAKPRTRWSFSVDHVIPLSRGGPERNPELLRPAHYGCNARRGNRTTPPPKAAHASRRW